MEKVSCICPTFNRPGLLCEAIHWFTVQDYPARELVILNDNSRLTLRCKAENVRCINTRTRFSSIGAKYAALAELATGSVLLPWEDDDIGLPLRVSQSVARLGAFDYWNPRGSWYEQAGQLHHTHRHGYCLNASAIRKAALSTLPFPDSNAWDRDWCTVAEFAAVSHADRPTTGPREWQYVYRWGVSCHLSGNADMQAAYSSADPGETRTIQLIPRMGGDYQKETQCVLASL